MLVIRKDDLNNLDFLQLEIIKNRRDRQNTTDSYLTIYFSIIKSANSVLVQYYLLTKRKIKL